MNRDDQARAKCLDAAFSSRTIGLTAPPPRQIEPRDVVLEQLEQLCTRCRLRHTMTSVKPAHGYSMPCSSAPARGKSGRASSRLFCRTLYYRQRQIPKPMPLSAARRGPVSAGVSRRVKVEWRGHATYLFAPLTMMVGRARLVEVGMVRVCRWGCVQAK